MGRLGACPGLHQVRSVLSVAFHRRTGRFALSAAESALFRRAGYSSGLDEGDTEVRRVLRAELAQFSRAETPFALLRFLCDLATGEVACDESPAEPPQEVHQPSPEEL